MIFLSDLAFSPSKAAWFLILLQLWRLSKWIYLWLCLC